MIASSPCRLTLGLADIEPVHVAAYIEQQPADGLTLVSFRGLIVPPFPQDRIG
jgi:hypothetical protein